MVSACSSPRSYSFPRGNRPYTTPYRVDTNTIPTHQHTNTPRHSSTIGIDSSTMANSNSSSDDDFHHRVLSSFHAQQLLLHSSAGSSANDVQQLRQQEESVVQVESYAKFLVEDDIPKIDHAVKSYLSLVAARSAVQSEIDVISTSPLSSSSSSSRAAEAVGVGVLLTNDNEEGRRQQCTFAGSIDANKCALLCARTLLSTINSTILPLLESDDTAVDSVNDEVEKVDDVDDETKRKEQQLLHKNTTRIIWNKLANSSLSSSSGGTKIDAAAAAAGGGIINRDSKMKPSKVVGRHSLLIAYPYIQERFRRGVSLLASSNGNVEQDGKIDTTTSTTTTTTTDSSTLSEGQLNPPLHALSNKVLPPVLPPKGVDIEKWRAFYLEFGHLLLLSSSSNSSAVVMQDEGLLPNDSALLWSKDGGAAELQLRRESRTRRAAEAMAFDSGSARGEDDNE